MRNNLFITGLAAITLTACVHPVNTTAPTATTAQLPTIFAGQVVTGPANNTAQVQSTSPAQPGERRITVTASNADVRELIPAIAAAGGISVVMSPDVQGRVSVRFVDVPVSQALRAVITEAGLTVGSDKLESPWAPAVFFSAPVNVNVANAQLISAHFGVSEALARVVVESRDAIDKSW